MLGPAAAILIAWGLIDNLAPPGIVCVVVLSEKRCIWRRAHVGCHAVAAEGHNKGIVAHQVPPRGFARMGLPLGLAWRLVGFSGSGTTRRPLPRSVNLRAHCGLRR
jgi:hypothetical protein